MFIAVSALLAACVSHRTVTMDSLMNGSPSFGKPQPPYQKTAFYNFQPQAGKPKDGFDIGCNFIQHANFSQTLLGRISGKQANECKHWLLSDPKPGCRSKLGFGWIPVEYRPALIDFFSPIPAIRQLIDEAATRNGLSCDGRACSENVAIHVRLTDQSTSCPFHVTCMTSKELSKAVIQVEVALRAGKKVFVFSNAMPQARELFKKISIPDKDRLRFVDVVAGNPSAKMNRSVYDMVEFYMMGRYFGTFIVSGSTMSMWAFYLSPLPRIRVVIVWDTVKRAQELKEFRTIPICDVEIVSDTPRDKAPTSKQETGPCARLTDIWGSVKCSRWVKVRDQLYFAWLRSCCNYCNE